jgi:hypothetical protein
MASNSGGSIIKIGLLAGGAYLIWKEFFSSSTPAVTQPGAPPAGGDTPPPPPPPYQYTPPSTVQALQNAAGAGVTVLNADQWAYYWTNTLKKTAIPDDAFSALFFPSGRPSDPAQNPTMNANQFVAALATKGISGYRGVGSLAAGVAQPLWLPVILQPGGRARLVSNYRRRANAES